MTNVLLSPRQCAHWFAMTNSFSSLGAGGACAFFSLYLSLYFSLYFYLYFSLYLWWKNVHPKNGKPTLKNMLIHADFQSFMP